MHHFDYRNGILHAEDIPLPRIAEEVGTPFYCYASTTLERHYRVFAKAIEGLDAGIHYSIKANSNLAILKILARLGAGADIVSAGELYRALAAGIPPEKIVFSGVGKQAHEIEAALKAGVFLFNVESEPELRLLSALAEQHNTTARTAIRINPDVDAQTHAKISTGKAENKFGIPWKQAPSVYGLAASLPGIRICGIDVHIGSQLTDLTPFANAFARVAELTVQLRAEGHNIQYLDLGGGLGIPYQGSNTQPPHPDEYAALVQKTVGSLGCRLLFEPGRMIVGNAGILVTRVLYEKQGENRFFLITDAAMNDLIRPTLYDVYHEVLPVCSTNAPLTRPCDIVGPVCETGDFLAKNRQLPPLHAGDLLAIMSVGAYGAVLSSTYNSRPLIPEVLVKEKNMGVIRARPGYDALLKYDTIPEWLDPA